MYAEELISWKRWHKGFDYEIRGNIKVVEKKGDLLKKSKYQRASEAEMNFTKTISTTFDFSSEIGPEEFKTKVGYSKTESISVSETYKASIPENTTCVIEVYSLVEESEFEAWENDLWFDDYIGIFHSYKPIGMFFVHYYE